MFVLNALLSVEICILSLFYTKYDLKHLDVHFGFLYQINRTLSSDQVKIIFFMYSMTQDYIILHGDQHGVGQILLGRVDISCLFNNKDPHVAQFKYE
jgi:hypothetical protein